MSEEEKKNEEAFLEWISSPQMLVSLSAVVLSICGLFVAIYETSLMREQQEIMRQEQYASVWPHIEIGPSSLDDIYQIRIQNTGVGPAQIRGAAIKWNGNIIENWYELGQKLTGIDSLRVGRIKLINGSVLPPSQEPDYIYRIDASLSEYRYQLSQKIDLETWRGNLNVDICYCSVYEECWTTSLQNSIRRLRGERAISKKVLRIDSCEDFPNSGI